MRLGSASLMIMGLLLSGLIGRPTQALDFDAELQRLNRQVDQSRARVALNDPEAQRSQIRGDRTPSASDPSAEFEESFEVKLITKRGQRR